VVNGLAVVVLFVVQHQRSHDCRGFGGCCWAALDAASLARAAAAVRETSFTQTSTACLHVIAVPSEVPITCLKVNWIFLFFLSKID